jgi:3-phenylpropionate/trans-cinnamate dioxygenase ferredoxin reductase subunit
MIIAGGRSRDALYMVPALARLARFPNVVVVPVCSGPEELPQGVMPGRPTDYVPRLMPTDVVYACGAPAMVDAVKTIAGRVGAACHADPFMATQRNTEQSIPRPSTDGPLDLAAFRDLARLGRDRGLTA